MKTFSNARSCGCFNNIGTNLLLQASPHQFIKVITLSDKHFKRVLRIEIGFSTKALCKIIHCLEWNCMIFSVCILCVLGKSYR